MWFPEVKWEEVTMNWACHNTQMGKMFLTEVWTMVM